MTSTKTKPTPTSSKSSTATTVKGYEPQPKKQKVLLAEANRSEQYLLTDQPGRVELHFIGWHQRNRGGQGLLPLHVHDIAENVCTKGTSKRRYGQVRLVEVPDDIRQTWLDANSHKAKRNPWLPEFLAMSHNGVSVYACINCSHFVSAQQLIKEGGRRYQDKPEGQKLQLKDDDNEGKLIQRKGVDAIVYSSKLWYDPTALLALMREDNLDAEIKKPETELDCFGHCNQLVQELLAGCGTHGRTVTTDEVMGMIAELGYGNMSPASWKHLVTFRLALSNAHADMLFDCLVQVCNGRVRTSTETYAQINNLQTKGQQWPKVFLLMETYTQELLSEDTGLHKPFKPRTGHVGSYRASDMKEFLEHFIKPAGEDYESQVI